MVSHDYQAEFKALTFMIEPSLGWIDGLFPKPISDVTAIIGANGSGKSSILELVADILSNKPSPKWGLNVIWVAVLENETSNEVYAAYNFEIDGEDHTECSIQIQVGKTGLLVGEECQTYRGYIDDSYSFTEYVVGLDNTAVIFYSPIFGIRHDQLPERETLANVSTGFLVVKDSVNNDIGELQPIFNYRFNNLKRQLDFVSSFGGNFQEFQLPRNVTIRFEKGPGPEKGRLTNTSWKIYDELSMASREQMNSKYNDPIINAISHEEKQRAILEKAKIWFVRNLLTNFFHYLSSEHEDYWIYEEHKNKGRKPIAVDISELGISRKPPLGEYGGTDEFDFIACSRKYFDLQNVISKKAFDIPSFIDRVVKVIDKFAFTNIDNDDNESYFTIPAIVGVELYESYKEYLRAFGVEKPLDFMHVEWTSTNLSSGEIALLDLYSRIYLGIQKLLPLDSKSLFIFIDEGELGFHPEWQRKYLNEFIHHLSFMESSKSQSIQIILASHSPFLVSDLPMENVIFLDRKEEEKTKTFAANIHSLFSHSFFLKSTMGEFAKKKLNEVVEILKVSKSGQNTTLIRDESKLEYARKIIDTVGEDVLRERLWDLYAECTKGSDLDVELAKAKKKVQELEEQKRRRDAEN